MAVNWLRRLLKFMSPSREVERAFREQRSKRVRVSRSEPEDGKD